MTIVYSQTGLSTCQERIMEAIEHFGGRASTPQLRDALVPFIPGAKKGGQIQKNLYSLADYGFLKREAVGTVNVWGVVR